MIQKYVLSLLLALFSLPVFATDPHGSNHPNSSIVFTPVRIMEATPVKSQGKSSTCWSFSGVSFFESEMMRKGKPAVELSEMFVVRMVYLAKAIKYVRMHGTIAFPAGGAFSDPLYVLREYGFLPRLAYEGNVYAPDAPINHGELDEILQAYVQAVVKNKNKELTPVWLKGFERILDTYLGELPVSFSYGNKQYNRPEDFRKAIDLNASDYVSLTSFMHHPFLQSIRN
jgi:bleomycin hydrolase